MFPQFRARYPKGCLTTELITIHEGLFVVKAMIQVEGITLSTGLAAFSDLEQAEDRARARALQVLGISGSPGPIAETSLTAIDHHPALEESVRAVRSSPEVVSVRPTPVVSQPVRSASSSETMPQAMPQAVTVLSRQEDLSPEVPPEVSPEETPLLTALEPEYLAPEPEPDSPPAAAPILDVAEIITMTTVEMKRLGWSDSQGRDYLMKTYGKKSRYSLNDEELAGFLQYLQTQPTPD